MLTSNAEWRMANETTQAIRDAALSRIGYLRPAFLTLHISGGLVGLPLLVLTFLTSSAIPRQPTLTNFCITWVINSISYIIGTIGGATETAPRSVCFAQVALIFGSPPMAATATLLLVIQIWHTFRDPMSHRLWLGGYHYSQKVALFITLSIPYIIFFVFLIESIVLELKFPDHVDRSNGLYCTMVGIPLRHWSVPTYCFFTLMIIVGFEIAIARRYYSSRKRIVDSFPLADRSTSLGLVVRITLFNVYLLVTMGASVVFLSRAVVSWTYMIQAAIPVVNFLLFVTQRNVILAWCFWRKRDKETHSDGSMGSARNPTRDAKVEIIVAPVTPSSIDVERV